MSLWGPGKNHCSIRGHKKGINLNLVYNAMPFKLIHLACALELPAIPSFPHSLRQHSLSAGGVNVNSATVWTESWQIRRQKRKIKTKIKYIYIFTSLKLVLLTNYYHIRNISIIYCTRGEMKISLNAEELCTALLQFNFTRWWSGTQI